jgi:hypothetical protein
MYNEIAMKYLCRIFSIKIAMEYVSSIIYNCCPPPVLLLLLLAKNTTILKNLAFILTNLATQPTRSVNLHLSEVSPYPTLGLISYEASLH